MNRTATILVRLLWLVLLLPSGMASADGAERVVAATVDGRPIYVEQVERLLTITFRGRKIEPQARALLKAQALSQLIDRQLVLAYLSARKMAAGQQDLDDRLDQIERKLKTQNLTLEEFLKRSGQTKEDLVADQAWEMSWQRYLDRNVTDQTLQKYFDANRREWDGTRLRVRHILLAPTQSKDPAAVKTLHDKAAAIRADIVAGTIEFAAAARQHSSGPSAAEGGDLGFIERRGAMGEEFAKTAFSLEPGEVSQPLASRFGIHLIQVTEVRPGDRKWADVRNELEPALQTFLFQWLAERQRATSKVHFTGNVPHFKPGTRELVAP